MGERVCAVVADGIAVTTKTTLSKSTRRFAPALYRRRQDERFISFSLGSDFVEAPRVCFQYRFFVFIPEVIAFDDFVDLLHAIVEGDLVREVRSEHERPGSHAFDGISQGFFVALAADENFTACEIIG